jgi:5'-nucleotidase
MTVHGPAVRRVLITNDDGIDAPGLAVLEAVAETLAREVWVVAPEHDQSGVSHSPSACTPHWAFADLAIVVSASPALPPIA